MRRTIRACSLVMPLVASSLFQIPSASGATPQRVNRVGKYLSATWSLGDANGTTISIAAQSATEQLPPGAPRRSEVSDVSISGMYCETATDTLIVWGWGAAGPDTNGNVSIGRSLSSGSASGTLRLIGQEIRFPGCDEETGGEITFNDLGSVEIHFAASWIATGPLVRSNGKEHYLTPDGGRISEHVNGSYREAAAKATIASDDSAFDFGSSSSWHLEGAFIQRGVRMEQLIGHCFFGGTWPHCDGR